MVINAAAYQRIAFYFVLAAIYYRRHFGKAETVQIPARFTVNFEIFDFVYSNGYYYAYISRNEMERHNNVLENTRNL